MYFDQPVRTVAPASALFTLAELKAQLRIEATWTDDDALLTTFIAAATERLDGLFGVLGRCIAPQTWRVTVGDFCSVRLPFPDVISGVVTYLDTANATQTLNASLYRLRNDAVSGIFEIVEGVWPPSVYNRPDAVTITAQFGFATIPAPIKVAALSLAAHMFENPEAGKELPPGVVALLAPYRAVSI